MAAAANAMDACLGRIGFNPPAVLIIRSHGVTSAEAFRTISYQSMAQFIETIVATRTAPVAPPAAVARGAQAAAVQVAAALAAQPIIMPYTALRGLKALRAWLDYRFVRGEPLDVDEFDDAARDCWILRIDVLDDNIRNPPGKHVTAPPSLSNFNNWAVWEQQFITYVSNFRGSMCAVPLTYLLRTDDVPTAETMARVFDDVDEALVATFRLDSPVFRADTTKLYDLLKPLIIQGSCYSFILPVDGRRNGREAYLILKAQAEGPAQLARRRVLAYSQLNTKYSGWSRRFSFDDYIAVYQQAFNELTYLGEVISETKKVNDFLSNITDPKFDTIKTFITGDANINSNFEVCQQRARQMVDQVTTQNANKRNVSAVATRPANRPAKRGKDGKNTGRRQRPMNRGIQHYSKDVWDKMTDEQKQKLRDDRAKAKAAKANIRSKAERDVRNVSAVYTVPRSSPDQDMVVERNMFELDLDGEVDTEMGDPDMVTIDIPPIPFIKPPPPSCNSSKMVFHRTGDDQTDFLIHNKAEALYKSAVMTWTDDVKQYNRKLDNFKSMGRLLPIPEYPATPPPYETFANHVKEMYDRGITEVNKIQAPSTKAPPLEVAAKVTKRPPVQAVASLSSKPPTNKTSTSNPSKNVVIDVPKEHPLKATLMADIKTATAAAMSKTTQVKPKVVRGRHWKSNKAKKGFEPTSSEESASDNEVSIITHDHTDTKN
jgi:hypothetical protein